MKRLSGEMLSRLLWAVTQCNQSEKTSDEVRELLLSAMDVKDLYVELPAPADAAAPSGQPAPRFATFEDSHLQRLNSMLPWSSYAELGSGATLGAPWSVLKRSAPTRYPDPEIENLNRRLPLAGLSVLELGCFEGHHSICLAQHGAEVWAIDGRVENVIKSVVRVWMAGMDRQITTQLLDLERGPLQAQLAALGREQGFDLVYHRGVLYHLSDPVANLLQCAEVSRRHLYLHTQIAAPAQADAVLKHEGREYEVFRYREPSVDFAPFAGITTYAHWLTQASLERLLADIGFAQVEVLSLHEERNGLRLELIASR